MRPTVWTYSLAQQIPHGGGTLLELLRLPRLPAQRAIAAEHHVAAASELRREERPERRAREHDLDGRFGSQHLPVSVGRHCASAFLRSISGPRLLEVRPARS